MKKNPIKKILIILAMTILLLPAHTVYGAEEISVLVNGQQVPTDTPAVIVSGTTMLPFRSIFNALGIDDQSIIWDQKSQSIEVRNGDQYVFLLIGNTGALVDDKLITLNVAPYVENGSTLVPVRFVSEALGAEVQWDKNTKTVKITKK